MGFDFNFADDTPPIKEPKGGWPLYAGEKERILLQCISIRDEIIKCYKKGGSPSKELLNYLAASKKVLANKRDFSDMDIDTARSIVDGILVVDIIPISQKKKK